MIDEQSPPGYLISICEDIGDRKRAEQMLGQHEQMATIGRLTSSIVHEINSPLEAVFNLVFLARRSTTLGEATVAAYHGLHNQEVYLSRQPEMLAEAIHWTRWFHSHGYTVSVGLMQINSENAAWYGVTVRQLFDPCTNVAIGARMLEEIYSTTQHSTKPDTNSLMSRFPHTTQVQ